MYYLFEIDLNTPDSCDDFQIRSSYTSETVLYNTMNNSGMECYYHPTAYGDLGIYVDTIRTGGEFKAYLYITGSTELSVDGGEPRSPHSRMPEGIEYAMSLLHRQSMFRIAMGRNAIEIDIARLKRVIKECIEKQNEESTAAT